MTDNINITAGSGTVVGTDNIGGTNYQRIKLILGSDGNNDGDVSSSLPMPVTMAYNTTAIPAPVPTVAISSAYAHTATTTPAYTYGSLWANNATAGSVTFSTITVAKANNQAFSIVGGFLQKSGNGTTNAIFRAHFFTAAPTTAVADKGTWAGSLTLVNEVGAMDFTLSNQGSDVASGLGYFTAGSLIASTPLSGAQTLVIAYEVRGAYTPLSAETLTLTLFIQ